MREQVNERGARSTRRRRGAGIALASVLAALMVLTGCTGIPGSGAVTAGEDVEVSGDFEVDFLPSSPQKDGEPEVILRGFIEAASSPLGNYAIAREFLTPALAQSWQPDVVTTIDLGRTRQYTKVTENQMELTVSPIADVDSLGEYRQTEQGSPVPLPFSFEEVDGQWRISAAPDGTLLDQVTFNEVFSTHPLYFFDPGFNYLVPDLRWFPRRESTPTRIVKALLNGPAEWLLGGVVSAFPEGSVLTADTVQVIDRDAKVDLGADAFQAERPTLQRMKLQLKHSLTSVTAISSVTISIDDAVQDVPDITSSTVLVNPRVDARPLIFREGAFGFLPASGEQLVPIPGISSEVAGLQPLAATISANQQNAAVLSADGVYLIESEQSPQLADNRPGLIAPALDNLGFVWSVPAAEPSALQAYSSEIGTVNVPTTWPESTEIVSIALARDGSRLVALLRSGGDTLLVAAAVLRGEGNVPIGIGPPLTLRVGVADVLDVVWVDESTVATLSDLGEDGAEVATHQIGGRSIVRGIATEGVLLSAGNTVRDLRVLGLDGKLQTQRGQGWQTRIDGVGFVATQQGLPVK